MNQELVFCRGNVGEVLDSKDQRGEKATLMKELDLEQVVDRDVEQLSGAPCFLICKGPDYC